MKKKFTQLTLTLLLFCSFHLIKAQSNVFESEPNNSFSTADPITLGDTIRSNIGTIGDQDFFSVTISQAGVFDVIINNIDPIIDVKIELYDGSQNFISGINGSNGSPVYFRKLVCSPGTYFFKLYDVNNNESATQLHNLVVLLDVSDVYECNNSFSSAAPILFGDTIRGAINDIGDQDYFQVNVPRAGVLDISVTNISSPVDMRVYIYNSNQTFLVNEGYWNSNGNPVFLRELVCDPGIYYIRLEDFDSDQSSRQLYKFVVELDTTDAYECNNTFTTASPIAFGDTIRAAINDIGDQDYFQVNVPRAGVLDISVTNISSPVDMLVNIYNSNQTSLVNEGYWNSNGNPVFLRELVCDAGVYYIRLIDFDNNQSSRQLYKFVVQLDTTDVYECNNNFTTAAPIAFGDTIRAAINDIGDKDYFQVNVPRAGVLDVSVTNISSPVDMRAYIYNSNQTFLVDEGYWDSNGNPVFLRELVCDAGVYYIRLEDFDNNQSSRQLYKFVVQLDTTDAYECNNTFTTAAPITFGDTIRAAINDIGDKDYFQVNVPRAGVLDISVTNISSPVDMRAYIYNSNQTFLVDEGYWNSNGNPVFLRKLVCDPGIYYIRLEDFDNNQSSRQLYKFVVQLDTSDTYECNDLFNTASPVNSCDTIFGSISIKGDQDYYTLNTLGGQYLPFALTNVAPNINTRIRIYDGFQTQIYSRTLNLGQPVQDSVFIPSTGQYFIRINDDGDNESNTQLYRLLLKQGCIFVETPEPISANWKVYPNPTSDEFMVHIFPAPQAGTPVHVWDATGRKVKDLKWEGEKITISLRDLPAGMYFVNLPSNPDGHFHRVIKF